jgi:hypothetical protein
MHLPKLIAPVSGLIAADLSLKNEILSAKPGKRRNEQLLKDHTI